MQTICSSDKTISRKNLKNVKRPYCADDVLLPVLADDDRTPLFSGIVDGTEVYITGGSSPEAVVRTLIEANASNVREYLHCHCIEPVKESLPLFDGITWTVDQVEYDKQTNEWNISGDARTEIVEPYPMGTTTARIDRQIQHGQPDPDAFITRRCVTLKFSDTDRAKSCQAWLTSKYKFPAGALIVADDETWLIYPFTFNPTPEELIIADGRKKLAMLQAPIRKRLQEVSSFPIFDGTNEGDRLLAELVRLSAESGRRIDDERETFWSSDEPLDDDQQYRIDHGDSRHCRRFLEAIAPRFGIDVESSLRLDVSVPMPFIGEATEIVADPISKNWFKPVTEKMLEQIADEITEEAALWNPGGLLQEWIDFNLRTAHKRQPELACISAIAGFATLIGRKVQDDYGTTPNCYLIGIAASSAGKQHPMNLNKLVIATAGGGNMLQDGLASHAGLHSALVNSPSTLLQSDEMGRLMTVLGNSKQAPPHLAGIIDIWLKLFSSASTVYIAPAYADKKNNHSIQFPNFCIYGTSIPANFYGSLTKEALSDGLFNRFLIVEASDNNPPMQKPDPLMVPPSLAEVTKWWHNYKADPLADGGPRILTTSPVAEKEFKVLNKIVDRHRLAEEKRGTQVWGRTWEYARKLALIHQCSLNHEAVEISGPSAKWACAFVLKLTQRMEQLAADHVADGAFDAIGKKLLLFIRDGGTGGRTRREVSRQVRNLPARDMDAVLAKLEENGEIEKEPYQPPIGRPAWMYRAI